MGSRWGEPARCQAVLRASIALITARRRVPSATGPHTGECGGVRPGASGRRDRDGQLPGSSTAGRLGDASDGSQSGAVADTSQPDDPYRSGAASRRGATPTFGSGLRAAPQGHAAHRVVRDLVKKCEYGLTRNCSFLETLLMSTYYCPNEFQNSILSHMLSLSLLIINVHQ